MKIVSRHSLFVSLIAATLVAGCGSDKVTGPSSISLVQIFDSVFIADTTSDGGLVGIRAEIDRLIAFTADEGQTPATVQLSSAAGSVRMQMVAFIIDDTTAVGTPYDTLAYIFGWTSDYRKYLILDYNSVTGLGPPGRRIGHTPPNASLALRAIHASETMRTPGTLDLSNSGSGIFDGNTEASSDSVIGHISWVDRGTPCAWQHLEVPGFSPDSTTACSYATVATGFTAYFTLPPGVDPAFARIIVPSTAIPAIRMVGWDD